MSVIIEDLLKLPSLKNARVLAGHSAMKRTVTGITVLEFAQPGPNLDSLYRYNAPYIDSQICITGFATAYDNVERQCSSLRNLASMGVAGMILYYVGIFIPKVDERLIQTANEAEVALIVMPEGRYDLRYGDVIADVMEAIVLDRMQTGNIMGEIVRRMMELPQQMQTLESAMHLISQWTQTTVALTDTELNPICESVWPRRAAGVTDLLTQHTIPAEALVPSVFAPIPGSYIWFMPIQPEHGPGMNLYLINEARVMREEDVRLIANAVQLSVDLWNRPLNLPLSTELVRAILRDEPIKMRRLADVMGIDIASIHTMWVARPNREEDQLTAEAVEAANSLLSCISRTVLVDLYGGGSDGASDLIVFFENAGSLQELMGYAETLVSQLNALCPGGVTLTMSHYAQTTADVRAVYHQWNEYESDARVILPRRRILREQDIAFAQRCRDVIKLGEHNVTRALSVFSALNEKKQPEEYHQTLAVYLLDADMSVQETADILFVHKNTIKYRLKQCTDCLGFPIGEMPATMDLLIALAVERLLEKGK